jgi:hypothetical protein
VLVVLAVAPLARRPPHVLIGLALPLH